MAFFIELDTLPAVPGLNSPKRLFQSLEPSYFGVGLETALTSSNRLLQLLGLLYFGPGFK